MRRLRALGSRRIVNDGRRGGYRFREGEESFRNQVVARPIDRRSEGKVVGKGGVTCTVEAERRKGFSEIFFILYNEIEKI